MNTKEKYLSKMTPMHCQHKRKKYKKKLHNSQFIKNYFLQFIQSNNYYGGNGMYQYKFSDEDEKRILEQIDSTNNKKESDTSLSDQFSQIDNKYDMSFDTNSNNSDSSIKFEKLDNIEIDQDKIKQDAENSLAEERKNEIDSIINEAENSKNNINASIENVKSSAETQKSNLDKLYEERKQVASDEALKRGLGRSSIIINQIDAFEKEKIDEYMAIDKELSTAINNLNTQLGELESSKQKALSDYDIAYAVKLNEKIKEINDELYQKQQEVIKYNNEIAEKEAEYNLSKEKQDASIKNDLISQQLDVAEFIEKYGINALYSLKYQDKFNAALDYFNNFDKATALNELKNNATYYKEQLGNKYYDLLARMNNR